MIKFSVKHPVSITMLIGVLITLGIISLTRLGFDLFPDINYPSVTVITQYQNVAPEDIEELITKPIEGAVSTVSGVKKVTSISAEGVSAVTVEFEWGTNLDFAAQDVRDKVALIEDYLPEDASKPIVLKFDISQIPIIQYIAYSDRYKLTELKDILRDDFKSFLERIEGVASVDIVGGRDIQYWVTIDLEKIAQYNLSFSQITQFIAMNNFNLPSGKVDYKHKNILLRTIGQYNSIEDLENQVVGYTPKGTPIFLKDIGKVTIEEEERLGYAKLNNKESIALVLYKQSGANTLQVSNRVKKAIKTINAKYPSIKLVESFDQGKFIKLATSRTVNNAIVGAVLAALLIFLFLMDIRPTFVVAIAIPLSVVLTFIVLNAFGYTLNMMTLGGIALGVGMLVDAAIVVIENIFRHEEMGESPKEAAMNGAQEVWLAISASTFTNIAVFLPLIYIGGIIGQVTKPLAVTVTSVLLASLFVSVTIIPMLTSQIVKRKVAVKEATREYWFGPIKRFYRKILEKFVLRKRGLILGITAGLFLVSLILIKFIGIEFMPQMDRSFGIVQVELPPGTSLKETENYLDRLSDIASQYPEIEDVVAIGGVFGEEGGLSLGGASGSHTGTITLSLKDPSLRDRTSYEVINDFLSKIPNYHGAMVKAFDMTRMMFLGANARPIQINIYGEDLDEMNALAEKIKTEISKIEGVYLPEISLKKAKPEFRIHINRVKAAYYGLTTAGIQRELQIALHGSKVSLFKKKGKEYDIVVKADTTFLKEDYKRVKYFPIKTPTGSIIPLKEVADFSFALGPIQIDREKQSRVVKVMADNKGRSTGEIMRDISKVLKSISVPTGYSIELSGEFEQIQEMIKDMLFAIIGATLLVYMIMAAQFESFKDPFIVIFSLPLAIIGVVLIFLITGTTISVPSLVGVLILIGIAVNEGIVMITLIKQLRNKGVPDYEAVVEGASIRLRPVMIAGLTTIFGMLPMALSTHGHGAEMRSPMAIAIIGGLFTAMILTLFVIPVIYTIFEKIKPPEE